MMLMGASPQDRSKIAWRPQNAFPVSPPQRPMYACGHDRTQGRSVAPLPDTSPLIPARPVRRAGLSMPAAVAINRTLFASRVVMKPMPTLMRRSTYYGARTARCSLWRNTAASGPTKQEPSGGLLDAEHRNPTIHG